LLVIVRERSWRNVVAVCSTLLPALCWYVWANHVVGAGAGSRASADNRSIWLGLLGPWALLKWDTFRFVSWFLLVRAFTPVGAGLALVGLSYAARKRGESRKLNGAGAGPFEGDALWIVWGISALAAMACLAEKLHHEYYWLLLAPVAALGIGRAVATVGQSRRDGAFVLAAMLLVLCGVQVRSTWQTPPEWAGLLGAAGAVATNVPADAWVVAPEALLFQADRRGCRMEWSDASAARAAGEWGVGDDVHDPLELIEFYRRHGARYFADLGTCPADGRRKGLHEAVRRRYKVIVDRPDVIIADLADSEMHWNGN
jgi:hypothetical protein